MWDRPALMNGLANALYAVAAVLALYIAWTLAARLPVFALREVRVGGELAHVTRDQIEGVVQRELKGNFFTLDLAATRASFEKLPWVRKASVRRQWPARLDVALEEHVPLARWARAALVNTHGEVFQAAYDGELPVFIGPEGMAREIAIQFRYFRSSLADDRPDAGAGAGFAAPRLAAEARKRGDARARARAGGGAPRPLRRRSRPHARAARAAGRLRGSALRQRLRRARSGPASREGGAEARAAAGTTGGMNA